MNENLSDKNVYEMLAFVPTAGDLLTASDVRLVEALAMLNSFSQIDGAHHKAWVIDQVTRIITGDRYETFVKDYRFGEIEPELITDEAMADPETFLGDEVDYWDWDEGIAP